MNIVNYLDTNRGQIETELKDSLNQYEASSDYSVVWKEYEDAAVKAMIQLLSDKLSLTAANFPTSVPGKSKNRLADLLVVNKEERILISIKACRSSENPANDLGTFNQYPTKKSTYDGIFDIWVKYDDSGDQPTVKGVFFDRSYKFVGKMSAAYGGGVSYRKKDGNMRPKSWDMFNE